MEESNRASALGTDVETFRQLRAQFHGIRAISERLPEAWTKLKWTSALEDKKKFEALDRYWVNCFDEWMITSNILKLTPGENGRRLTTPESIQRVNEGRLWEGYYRHAITNAVANNETLLVALFHAYTESAKAPIDQDFVYYIWSLAAKNTQEKALELTKTINKAVSDTYLQLPTDISGSAQSPHS